MIRVSGSHGDSQVDFTLCVISLVFEAELGTRLLRKQQQLFAYGVNCVLLKGQHHVWRWSQAVKLIPLGMMAGHTIISKCKVVSLNMLSLCKYLTSVF